MPKCPSCGAEVKPSDKRCSKCGAALNEKKSNNSSSKLIIGVIAVIVIIAIVGALASGVFTGNDTSDVSQDSSSQVITPNTSEKTSSDNSQSESSSNDDSSASSSTEYWASAKAEKFHLPDCEWAQKISDSNKIIYQSREDAIEDGKVPCGVCNP